MLVILKYLNICDIFRNRVGEGTISSDNYLSLNLVISSKVLVATAKASRM